MKILFLIDSLAFAGAELYLVQLVRRAINKQLSFKIMLNSEQDIHEYQKRFDLNEDNFLFYEFNSKKSRIKKIIELRTIFKNLGFTHIHIVLQQVSASHSALIASAFVKAKLIVSYRLVDVNTLSYKQIIRNKIILRNANVLCVSKNNAEILINNYGLNASGISIVKNAAFIDDCGDIDSNYILKELNLERPKKIISMFARISEQKDHKTLLEAMKIVINEYPSAYLVLIGDINVEFEHYKKIKEITKRLNLEKYVAYLGFREDICQLLKCSEISVLSTHYEGQPKVILEAMKLKIPVIATDVSGISEIIENNLTGLLVDEENADDLAKAILSLLNNEEKRKNIIEKAFQSENLLSPEEMADETFTYYS